MRGKTLSEREYLATGVYQAMHPSVGRGVKADDKSIEASRERLLAELAKCNRELTAIEAEEQSLIARKTAILKELEDANEDMS